MAKVRTNTKGPFEEGSFDYDEFEKEAINRLKEGAGLVGSGGVLTGLIQCLVNAALGGEMNAHLKEDRAVEALHRQIRKVTKSKGLVGQRQGPAQATVPHPGLRQKTVFNRNIIIYSILSFNPLVLFDTLF